MFGARLKDRVFMKSGLQRPYLIIENALDQEFAERLHADLLSSTAWEADDKYAFSTEDQAKMPSEYSFTRDTIRMESPAAPQSVKLFYNYLSSDNCLQWITDVSGRMCNGFSASCARYRNGNHLTRHNDLYSTTKADGSIIRRTVTFNYYLAKHWQPEWGGRFVWENPHNAITPSFNTLVMFLVGPESMHYVEQVNEAATEPRLAITGWFITTQKPGYRKLNINAA